jgi:phage replication O-like protein O
MDRREPGFTKFNNYFLDHVMPRVTSVEWKLISAIIRETVGWHRTDAEISIDRLMALTGVARQAVVAGIKRACARTVVKRRTHQTGKQRSFRYSAVPHANLQAVPKQDPRRHQQAFSFTTEFENQTSITEYENQTHNAVSEFENQTSMGPGLRSRKKDQDLKTHTGESDRRASDGVCVDLKLTEERYRAYAVAHSLGGGWVTQAKRTREWDRMVLQWEDDCALEAERLDDSLKANAARRAREQQALKSQLSEWAERDRLRAAQAATDLAPTEPSTETEHQRRRREEKEAIERQQLQRGEQLLEEIRRKREQRKAATG